MILVTGASGGLAGLVLERLKDRPDVVAGSRTPKPDAVAGAAHGARQRHLDFEDASDLVDAMREVDTMLLVSAGYGEDDVVIRRHDAAISAAEKAGVRHIVYTSLSAAGDHLAYALPHRWTEQRLMRTSLGWTIMRNGIYAEMCVADAVGAAVSGVFSSPLGHGRLAAVAREDLADVTAHVLRNAPDHVGRTYELVGAQAIGGQDMARRAGEVAGRSVSYRPGTLAELREGLVGGGVPGWQVPIIMSTYTNVAHGFLESVDGDLLELLGVEPRPALDVIGAAVGRGLEGPENS